MPPWYFLKKKKNECVKLCNKVSGCIHTIVYKYNGVSLKGVSLDGGSMYTTSYIVSLLVLILCLCHGNVTNQLLYECSSYCSPCKNIRENFVVNTCWCWILYIQTKKVLT